MNMISDQITDEIYEREAKRIEFDAEFAAEQSRLGRITTRVVTEDGVVLYDSGVK